MNPNQKEGGETNAFTGYVSGGQKVAPKPMKLGSSVGSTAFNSYTSKAADLKSTEGLYDLAQQAGLGEQADKMIQRSGGESQKYMSGGFIMDSMDVLNTLSYGMVGLAKGKGFVEGIKNRESLSDEDALGKYGWQGKVAGFIGDIVLDPLTYIAPIKVISKIPGVAKGATALKTKMLGELETITVKGQKTFKREGGWTPLTFLSDKLVYGFAVSKEFLGGMQRIAGRNEAILGDSEKLIKSIDNINPGVFERTVTKNFDGSMISKPIKELEIEMRRDGLDAEYESVKQMYDLRDSLMNRLVDLGVISAETKDRHWGTYLKQSYDEFIEAKGLPKGTKSGVGIASQRRNENLSEKVRAELGQVKDGGVLWATTLLKQVDLVKKAELQKYVADGFAMSEDMLGEFTRAGGKMEDLHRVDESTRYTLRGREFDIKKNLQAVHTSLKTVLKQRKVAVKDDKELTATIDRINAELDRLKGASEDEIGEALTGFKQVLRESSKISEGPLKKVPTSTGQKALGDVVSKWINRGTKNDRLARETMSTADLWKEFKFTPEGIALSSAFNDPRLMYQWSSEIDFIDAIRYPDRADVLTDSANYLTNLTEAQQLSRIKAAEKNARRFGELEQTKKVLEETNLTLVREAVDKLESEYADLLWQKSGLLDSLEMNKMGQLSGKYVSKEVWNALKGTFEPSKEVGESLVLGFKHLKVVWNPGSHVRNAMSATIQNWWKLGMGPWRMDLYYQANKEFKRGSKDLAKMRELGFNERSGYMSELMDNYLTNKELVGKTISQQLGGKKSFWGYAKHLDKMVLNSYGHTDNIAKLAGFKFAKSQGLSDEAAYAQAMAATFNYSEITPFVHQMRRAIWGVPFITFALKALPLTVETLAKAPHRISVFGKARNDLFKAAGVEGDQEAEAMPKSMRDDMFVMRLPWKDSEGRSMYFDLSYIIPFGSLADGSLLKDPIAANPVLQLVRELSQNETFAGNKIFKESDDIDTVLADISTHVLKLGLPPPVTDFLPDGYRKKDGERAKSKIGWERALGMNTTDLGAGERTYYQTAFKTLGLGATPYELNSKESALAYTQTENLTKLLQENGIIKTYASPYLPQDSELRPENQGFGGESISDRDVKPIGR